MWMGLVVHAEITSLSRTVEDKFLVIKGSGSELHDLYQNQEDLPSPRKGIK